MGYPANRIVWCEEMDRVLREGIAKGKRMIFIADEIGVADNTARKRARELGIGPAVRMTRKPRPEKLFVESREMTFCDFLADGHSLDEIANLMGYQSRQAANAMLQRIRSKLGWQAV